jgi:hypothetical protein
MRKDKEAFIISISCMRLNGRVLLLKKLPVFAILQTCFDENTILVSWEVGAADDLADKEDFWLVVCSSPQVLLFGREFLELVLGVSDHLIFMFVLHGCGA